MEDFVSFELAKKLKEKGFNYECFGHYFDNEFYTDMPPKYYQREKYVSVPTISQVLKWLRDKKGLVIVVRLYSTNGWYWFIQDKNGELKSSYLASCNDCFPTYELAALAGVEYVVDNNLI